MIPVRLTTKHSQETKHRMVPNLAHGTLCRAFGLDPIRHRWDLPSTMKDASHKPESHTGKIAEGFLVREGDAVGKLTVCWESEKFRDWDPVTEWDKCG